VLAAILKDGPLPAHHVTQAARQHGISPRTLRRARRELNVESRVVGTYQQHQNWWLLPGQELPDSVESPEAKEVRKALQKLEEQWRDGVQRAG
jgi:transposase-like protein